jgi:hypothetical protein
MTEELKIIGDMLSKLTDGAMYGFILYVAYLFLSLVAQLGTIVGVVYLVCQTLFKLFGKAPHSDFVELISGRNRTQFYISQNEAEELKETILDRLNKTSYKSLEWNKIVKDIKTTNK